MMFTQLHWQLSTFFYTITFFVPGSAPIFLICPFSFSDTLSFSQHLKINIPQGSVLDFLFSSVCNLSLAVTLWNKFQTSPLCHEISLMNVRIIWGYFLIVSSTQIWGLWIGPVQFSCSVVSNSLQPLGLQHAMLTCPSPTPEAYSNSCPLSRWCHPTISSSVIPFSSHLQSFPASGSFPISQFFPSGGQSMGVSASASHLPMNSQDWFPLGWTGWISLHPRDSQESSPTPQFKNINSSVLSFLYGPTLTSIE